MSIPAQFRRAYHLGVEQGEAPTVEEREEEFDRAVSHFGIPKRDPETDVYAAASLSAAHHGHPVIQISFPSTSVKRDLLFVKASLFAAFEHLQEARQTSEDSDFVFYQEVLLHATRNEDWTDGHARVTGRLRDPRLTELFLLAWEVSKLPTRIDCHLSLKGHIPKCTGGLDEAQTMATYGCDIIVREPKFFSLKQRLLAMVALWMKQLGSRDPSRMFAGADILSVLSTTLREEFRERELGVQQRTLVEGLGRKLEDYWSYPKANTEAAWLVRGFLESPRLDAMQRYDRLVLHWYTP